MRRIMMMIEAVLLSALIFNQFCIELSILSTGICLFYNVKIAIGKEIFFSLTTLISEFLSHNFAGNQPNPNL